jgi:hypothetical protein
MTTNKPSIYRQENLPVQHALLIKWGDGLTLASLLKLKGYNHAPLYADMWGSIPVSARVWSPQVMLYEKRLSYGVRVVRHTYHAAP